MLISEFMEQSLTQGDKKGETYPISNNQEIASLGNTKTLTYTISNQREGLVDGQNGMVYFLL